MIRCAAVWNPGFEDGNARLYQNPKKLSHNPVKLFQNPGLEAVCSCLKSRIWRRKCTVVSKSEKAVSKSGKVVSKSGTWGKNDTVCSCLKCRIQKCTVVSKIEKVVPKSHKVVSKSGIWGKNDTVCSSRKCRFSQNPNKVVPKSDKALKICWALYSYLIKFVMVSKVG